MSILARLLGRRKSLSEMTRQELRRQELMLEKERGQLIARIEKLAKDKQSLFERGAAEKTPEVRRTLAQEFELRTSEQLMLGRQLNIRSKESMTVSRLRMIRENIERGQAHSARFGMVTSKDMLTLGKLIESDAVSVDMYQQRLDEILALGAEVDQGSAALSEAGQTVMDIWDRMDSGLIREKTEGFEEADRRVRERQAGAE